MPYLIVTSLYPSDKATEVAKKYLEAISKYPPNENLATPLSQPQLKAPIRDYKSWEFQR